MAGALWFDAVSPISCMLAGGPCVEGCHNHRHPPAPPLEPHLEDDLPLLLDERLALLPRQAVPEVLELLGVLAHPRQAGALLVAELAADALHVGEVHTHQLPPVLGVQAAERLVGLVPDGPACALSVVVVAAAPVVVVAVVVVVVAMAVAAVMAHVQGCGSRQG
jgi:hypothetical protein